MFKSICDRIFRRASMVAAGAGLALGAMSGTARAESAYSYSFGVDFTSHFISYGADVWGGGGAACPLSADATHFAYGTVTAKFSDQLSGFVNIWSDINDNTDSDIGGSVQEIDLNIGGTYTMDKWAFTLAHGCWFYASDTEHVIDFTVAYNDGGQFTPGFSLNPSLTVHYRYEGNGAQDTGVAIVPGIKPTFTFNNDSQWPVTIGFPVNVAFFSDDFQGGDSGYGYFSAGVAVTVPFKFIPEKYGIWAVTGSVLYYNTPSDSIPGNKEENFCVTDIGIGVSM